MRNLLLGAPALGDVLLRGNPSTIRQRLVHDLDRPAVGGFQDGSCRPLFRNVAQHGGTELVDIARERTGLPSDTQADLGNASQASPHPQTDYTFPDSAGCIEQFARLNHTATGP